MAKIAESHFIRKIAISAGMLTILLLVPALWIFAAFNSKYRTCVRLENGLNLGYEAVFDLSRPYFMPIAVPRLADGTPIIRDELWALFLTKTTIYGRSITSEYGNDFEFAWRADTGMVLKNELPDAYKGIVDEAGDVIGDYGKGSIGTGALLNKAIKLNPSDAGRCPTALVTW